MSQRRSNFIIAQRFIDPARLVFLDESWAKTNMTTLYGRARKGDRCVDFTSQGHWKTTTLLSAIRMEGVIQSATQLIDGTMDAVTFLDYTQRCLAPSLRPGDVVVMDNLSSHKTTGVAEAIEARGADLWYLPSYSPDLNPIEKLWSKIKAWLRRLAADSFQALVKTTAQAFRAVQPDECRHYFQSCGYAEK